MEALQQLISNLIAFVPSLFGAMLILLVGYILTRLLTTMVKKLLKVIGIDKLGDRLQSIDVVAESDIQISLSTLMSQVLYYFLMLVVLVAATDILGMPVVSNLVSSAIAYIPDLIAAIIILIVGVIFADVLKGFVVVTCRSFAIPAAGMVGSIVFWFVLVSVLISALSQAQIETSFIIANLSILLGALAFAFALAYGLAAKPLLGGFLAQFYNRGKINPGDTIRIEGNEGIVLSIDRASFTLKVDEQLLIVPLSKLQSETVLVIARAPGSDIFLEQRSRS
jgi:small-conductance mechanosensitive channel